jgi:hypothetical protein
MDECIICFHALTTLLFYNYQGSHLEYPHALAGFGITREILPLGRDDRLDYQLFLQLMEGRRRLEAESTARNKRQIDFPLSNDVLLGRGRPYQDFTGNARLSAIIDKHWDAYDQGNRT